MTERRTLTIPETAKALGIGRSAAYEGARSGQIPTIRIGKRILVPISALERMLAQTSNEAADGAHRPSSRDAAQLEKYIGQTPKSALYRRGVRTPRDV